MKYEYLRVPHGMTKFTNPQLLHDKVEGRLSTHPAVIVNAKA